MEQVCGCPLFGWREAPTMCYQFWWVPGKQMLAVLHRDQSPQDRATSMSQVCWLHTLSRF